jgi:AsmA protein
MAGSQIQADVEYYSPAIDPDYVKTESKIQNLIPSKVFFLDSSDAVPELFSGELNGSLICDVTLPADSNMFDKIFIEKGDLSFLTAQDTFNVKSLFIETARIDYNLDKHSNPLATLNSKIVMKAGEISTNILKVNDIHYDIHVSDGEYIIEPRRISFFGEEGHGKYILKPYAEIPFYELKYSIQDFKIENLLTTFLEDTIVTGNANFHMDIVMQGDHWDSIVSNLNGSVDLGGNDLVLYGLDADKLIEKLKRSQNFNLVDVGAVVLAGPVALAFTKGSDFARVIISNPGEETFIPELMSEWDIKNGKLEIQDVAFTTNTNRIAAQGWIDYTTDSLNITIAALNDKGCSIMSQDLYGQLNNPEIGELQVVKSLLAPVTNLVKGALGIECKIFYEGQVLHPPKK